MAQIHWASVTGEELRAEYLSTGSVGSLLPKIAAVYFWKLKLRPDVSFHDQDGLVDHVKRVASLPQARIGTIALSRSISIDGIYIGGAGLTEAKIKELRNFVSQPKRAQWLIKFLTDLESRIPTLYVGESGSLPVRIANHVSGNSDFGQAIEAEPDLRWRDLYLEYVKTGEATEDESGRRRTLEHLATVLTISNYTKRAG